MNEETKAKELAEKVLVEASEKLLDKKLGHNIAESDVEKITSGLHDALDILVKENVYEQTKHKDKEISGLHRQILGEMRVVAEKVDKMKTTLDEHDIVIKELMDIYKTSGHIKKVIIWLIFFVPSVAAFVAGVLYIKGLFTHQ